MGIRVIQGDCRDVLPTLAADSVHCVVTSPPYWGLRDYGVAGQIGLEPTIAEFVAEMVAVFREVRRVLRPDGTCWVNLGDSYAGSWGAQGRDGEMAARAIVSARQVEAHPKRASQTGTIRDAGLKPKDLCGVPWRVAFALQADGWYLRQDIIWAKPNPMPESVTDRCTKSHEYIFLLTKSARYYYDAEAIRESYADASLGRYVYKKQGTAPTARQPGGDLSRREREKGIQEMNPAGRNKRSVWTVATAPFSEAHFATFPPELIEPCIKAGTSEKGCCAKCGAPWVRVTGRDAQSRDVDPSSLDRYGTGDAGIHRKIGSAYQKWLEENPKQTLGWSPSCKCDAPAEPCTVIDPFGGAGTTGLVADRLQRNAILIELNPEYAKMASGRLVKDGGLFAQVAAE